MSLMNEPPFGLWSYLTGDCAILRFLQMQKAATANRSSTHTRQPTPTPGNKPILLIGKQTKSYAVQQWTFYGKYGDGDDET